MRLESDEMPFISILHDVYIDTVTIEVAPTGNLQKGTHSVTLVESSTVVQDEVLSTTTFDVTIIEKPNRAPVFLDELSVFQVVHKTLAGDAVSWS